MMPINDWFGFCLFFFSSRRRHTRCGRDWSSDVCSSDLVAREHVLRADLSRHPLRDALQDESACGVPVLVNHLLEAIEIEQDQRDRAGVSLGKRELGGEVLFQMSAVVQAR